MELLLGLLLLWGLWWAFKHLFSDESQTEVVTKIEFFPGPEQLIEEDRKIDLKTKYGNLPVEEIVFNNEIDDNEKEFLLKEIYGYTYEEAEEVIKTAEREEKRAKLREIKGKISKKAQELYSTIPVDDERRPIPDDVKMFVWNRDKGKCVRCGSQEDLEFDHIIPISKGGSNTARNIQLLCEKCNRSKRDDIV